MADESDLTPIEIDLTPREFDPGEEEIILATLEEDMPGFVLIPLQETGSRVLTAFRQDFSPPLSVLAEHAARVLQQRGIVVEEQSPPEEESRDIRLYHARHELWPDDRQSIAVVIELDIPNQTGRVLGIG